MNEVSFSMFNTTELIIESFYQKLNSNLIESEMPGYIRENLYYLLKLAEAESNDAALDIITNKTFLLYLLQMTNDQTIDLIEDEHRFRFNHILLDISSIVKSKDVLEEIAPIMIDIACNINMHTVQVLMGFGLDKEQATFLAAAKYVSTNRKMCYCAIVGVIESFPSYIATEQNMVDILGKLCADSATDLFIVVQNDFRQFEHPDSDEADTYYTMSLAVLDIIESLPMEGIYKVLTEYMFELQQTFSHRPRFMLRSCSVGDYPRFNHVIDILESEGREIF